MDETQKVPFAQVTRRDTGALIAMAANVAVLVGLVFVTVQIRQNTAAQRASAYQAWVSANAQLNLAISTGELSKTITAGHADPRKLTQDNSVAYAMWVLSFMQMAQSTDYLYRQGAIDKPLWDIEIQRAALHLTVPAVRQWWDAGGRTQLTPEFARLVESTKVTMKEWMWDPGVGFKTIERTR